MCIMGSQDGIRGIVSPSVYIINVIDHFATNTQRLIGRAFRVRGQRLAGQLVAATQFSCVRADNQRRRLIPGAIEIDDEAI